MPDEATTTVSPGTPAEAAALFNPFPGLRSFESDETHLFFGRDGQSDELLTILGRNRFVAVVGTSGSGKSSLVRAGLLPALERGFMIGAGSGWRIATVYPGAGPVENLATALNQCALLESAELDTTTRQILIDTTLRRNSFGLVEAMRLIGLGPRENLLVVVDQFEEVFRRRSDAGQAAAEEPGIFVRLLLEAVRQTELPAYVVITMRSDFLGDCARFRDLPEMLNRAQYLIPRMTREQRREAIEGPIAVGGATIAPRLVQRLLNDVGDEPDQLPILQHALMRTWDAWQRDGKFEGPIDLAHYDSIGGMADALSRHADEAYGELDERGKEIARLLFQSLAEKGPYNREARRPTRLEEICAIAEANADSVVQVIDRFRSKGRTFLRPPVEERLGPNSLIDISHESLIRLWTRLGEWTEEEAESAATYKRLADEATRNKVGRAALLRDPGLALVLEWKRNRRPNATWAERYAPGFADAMDFLDRSRSAGKFARQLRTSVVTVLFGLLFLLFGLALTAYRDAQKLKEASALLLARQLVAEAEAIDRDSPRLLDRSALLAEESAKRLRLAKRLPLPETDSFLRHCAALLERPLFRIKFPDGVHSVSFSPDGQYLAIAHGDSVAALQTATRKIVPLLKHGGNVAAIAFSPDGHLLAIGGDDKTLRVLVVPTGKEVSRLTENGPVLGVAFSPDGRYVATGSFDKSCRVLEAISGKEISRLKFDESVGAVVFSPDGRFVAAGSEDKTARVFEAATGKSVVRLTHGAAVWSLAFGLGGRLATASYDGTVRVFEAATGREVWRVAEGDRVNAVAFSPDGRYVATGGDDKSARVFEAATGREVWRVAEGDRVNAISFSPDSRYVAAASDDGTARAFEAATGWEFWRFLHDNAVAAVAFSPDGRRIATGSDDKSVRLFDTTKQQEKSLVMRDDKILAVGFNPDEHLVVTGSQNKKVRVFDAGTEVLQLDEGDQVLAVAFSSTGRYIAAGIRDGTARVFETGTGREVSQLKHGSIVDSVAFSPDGRLVATGSYDQTARVFEAATGREVSQFKHGSIVDSVAFSPDGRLVATGSYDRTARVFEAATGREVSQLKHGSIVDSVAFSPDGQLVATASHDKTARVFEAATGNEVWRVEEGDRVDVVGFSPDAHYVVTGSEDRTLRLFEAATGADVSRLPCEDLPLQIRFGRRGSDLVVALRSVDETEIHIDTYPIRTSDLMREVCSRLNRNLTLEEQRRYLPDEPYSKTCPNLP